MVPAGRDRVRRHDCSARATRGHCASEPYAIARDEADERSKGPVNSWKGPVVSAKALAIRLHPVSGEDVSVISRDFAGEAEALTAIARAVDERRSLVLTQARYDREAKENGLVVNLANVVTVQVSVADSATTGQYL